MKFSKNAGGIIAASSRTQTDRKTKGEVQLEQTSFNKKNSGHTQHDPQPPGEEKCHKYGDVSTAG